MEEVVIDQCQYNSEGTHRTWGLTDADHLGLLSAEQQRGMGGRGVWVRRESWMRAVGSACPIP